MGSVGAEALEVRREQDHPMAMVPRDPRRHRRSPDMAHMARTSARRLPRTVAPGATLPMSRLVFHRPVTCPHSCATPEFIALGGTRARSDARGGTIARRTPEIVARGLTNPRGFTWGEDGTLYVALAGTGGPNLPTEDATIHRSVPRHFWRTVSRGRPHPGWLPGHGRRRSTLVHRWHRERHRRLRCGDP